MIAQAKEEARNETLQVVDERGRLEKLDQALVARGIQPGSMHAVSLMAFAMETQRTVEAAYDDWKLQQVQFASGLAQQVNAAPTGGQPAGGRAYQIPETGNAREKLAAAVRTYRMGGV